MGLLLSVSVVGYAQESDAPSMALLEFLGESVKVEGELVDPLTWQAMEELGDMSTAPRQADDE